MLSKIKDKVLARKLVRFKTSAVTCLADAPSECFEVGHAYKLPAG